MTRLLDQVFDAQESRYFAPFLPVDLIEPLGVGSLTLSQWPNPEEEDFDAEVPHIPRMHAPDFVIAAPGAMSEDPKFIDNLMVQQIQASMGIPELIAILDTGILYHHPILKQLVVETIDLVGENGVNDGLDYNGHGTLVALLIALTSPNVQIINIKVADGEGRVARTVVARGIKEAAARAPNRVSLSLGFGDTCSLFRPCEACRAATEAAKAGLMVFAAAGNTPGLRACPARAKGVFSVASYAIESALSNKTSLTPESTNRLYGGTLDRSQVITKALSHAHYFIEAYQRHSQEASTVEKSVMNLKSAVILAKEAFRLSPESKREVSNILQSAVHGAGHRPWEVGAWLLEFMWYHLPDDLFIGLIGDFRGAIIPGTSFSVAAATAIPETFSRTIQAITGSYPLSDWAVMRRASYSGDGEFVGVDGRFIMVPYEFGLIGRAHLLKKQRRVKQALSRFESPSQAQKTPTDWLDQALLYIAVGKLPQAQGLLQSAVEAKPAWEFASRLLAELKG
jgi:hypothetical protein